MKHILAAMVIGISLGACGDDEGSGGAGGGASTGGGASSSGEGGSGGGGDSGQVGDVCTSAADCPAGGSGSPACLTDWPDGYCAVTGCEDHGHDCPGDPGLGGTATTGGKCVLDPDPTCLALCASAADCREGYTCESRGDAAGHGEALVCVPGGGGTGGGMSSSGSGGGMSSSSSSSGQMGGGMGM